MSNDDTNDRIKSTITIKLDYAKEDQPLIDEMLKQIIVNLKLSRPDNGERTSRSYYTWTLDTDIDSKPKTVESLMGLFDPQREPGDPSALEQLLETRHPHYDEACAWWESITQPQQAWFNKTYPDVTLVTAAWEVYQNMDVATRTMFHALK